MPSPEQIVQEAVNVAEEGLRSGEMPIGAVVFYGDECISRSFTKERELGRRIVHADLLALHEADTVLGFKKKDKKLILGVNLEPCMMCMGAAITLGVDEIYYALPSPDDGAHRVVDAWQPRNELAYFKKPKVIKGGLLLESARNQFLKYAASGKGSNSMRDWAHSVAEYENS